MLMAMSEGWGVALAMARIIRLQQSNLTENECLDGKLHVLSNQIFRILGIKKPSMHNARSLV